MYMTKLFIYLWNTSKFLAKCSIYSNLQNNKSFKCLNYEAQKNHIKTRGLNSKA